MATQLNTNIAGSQHNLILPEDHGKFNHMLMDMELMPVWAIVFKEGQDEAWLPYHLFSITFHFWPAYDKGTEAALNIHAIPSYDLGYLMPDSKVASNIALGNDLWWQEFHERYKIQAHMVVESQKAEVVKKAAEKAEKQKAEVELAKKVVAAWLSSEQVEVLVGL
ncbi:hypothetical protein BS17DRAFT_769648 [Gyrodon lividus]|nr:hypothetical protein BS17DRAFT_769648 [Gyrodon lividus]